MLAYVLLGLAAVSAVSADCSIDMNSDLPKHKSPLFLDNGNLLLPEPQGKTGVLKIASGEEVTLACPGNKNSVSKAKAAVVSATCDSGNKLNVNGKAVAVADLGCSKTAASSLRVTDKSCDEGGNLLELGFEVGDEWIKLVDVCHQVDAGHTLWSHHVVQGAALSGAEVESKRPSFTRGDKALYKGYNPDNAYKQANHKKMLEQVLGKSQADKLMGNTFIARGHLAPDADFIFGSWQFLTYFYANVAPQWQSINAGNWLATEKNVRKKAIELGRDLTVYTGTEGVLTIPNAKGVPTPLYLNDDDKKIPIPDNFWKVLYDAETKQGIALVGSNNPLLESEDNLLCKNICEANGWPTIRDYRKGLIYCCSVSDFQKAVSYAPKLSVSGVLQGPQ
ncbi:Dynein heavy chain 11, axonemal [Frankliniella fusca]|uniref:Dynein heavy chain 11, axonemal n=3 Tax=Arthropoda TaxID=6656 RepID=A0AAE1I3D0_9NEOP|nr:Dynein heavy chain 11, axonemal [Frankliniella fusca]